MLAFLIVLQLKELFEHVLRHFLCFSGILLHWPGEPSIISAAFVINVFVFLCHSFRQIMG